MKKSVSVLIVFSLLLAGLCFNVYGANLSTADVNSAFTKQEHQIYSQDFSSSTTLTDYVDNSLTSAAPFYNERTNALSLVNATVNGSAVKALASINDLQSVMTKSTYYTPVTYSVNMAADTYTHVGFTLRMTTGTAVYDGYVTSGVESVGGECIDIDLKNVDLTSNSMNITIANPGTLLKDSPHFSFAYPAGTNVTKLNKYDIIDNGSTIAIQITPDGSTTTTRLCVIQLTGLSGNFYTGGTVYDGNGVYVGQFTKNVYAKSRFGVHNRTVNGYPGVGFTFTNLKVLIAYRDVTTDFTMQNYEKYSQNFSSSTTVTDYVDNSLASAAPFYNERSNALSIVDATVNGSTVKALASINDFQSVMTKSLFATPVTYSVNMAADTYTHVGFTLRMTTGSAVYGGYVYSGVESVGGSCIDVDLKNVDLASNSMNITIANPGTLLKDSPHFSFAYPAGTDVKKLNKYDIVDNGSTIAIQITPDGSSTTTRLCVIQLSGLSGDYYTKGAVYNADGICVGLFTKNVYAKSRFGVHNRTVNGYPGVGFTFTNLKVYGVAPLADTDSYFSTSEAVYQTAYSENFSQTATLTDYVDNSLTTAAPFYNERSANKLSIVDATVNGNAVKALKSTDSLESIMTKSIYGSPISYSVNMGVNTGTHAGFTLRTPTSTTVYAGYVTTGVEGPSASFIDVDLQNVDLASGSMNITITEPYVLYQNMQHFSFAYPVGTDISKLNKYDIIDKGDSIAIQITPDGTSTTTKLCIIKLSNIVNDYYTSGTVYNGNGEYVGEFTKNVPVASRFGVHSRTTSFTFTNLEIKTVPIDFSHYTISGNKMSGLTKEMSTTAFLSNVINLNLTKTVRIYDNKGSEMTAPGYDPQTGYAYIGTGSTIKATQGNHIDEYIAVISGDVSGDGKIDISDLIMVKNELLGKTAITGEANRIAGDLSGEGNIKINDLLELKDAALQS